MSFRPQDVIKQIEDEAAMLGVKIFHDPTTDNSRYFFMTKEIVLGTLSRNGAEIYFAALHELGHAATHDHAVEGGLALHRSYENVSVEDAKLGLDTEIMAWEWAAAHQRFGSQTDFEAFREKNLKGYREHVELTELFANPQPTADYIVKILDILFKDTVKS